MVIVQNDLSCVAIPVVIGGQFDCQCEVLVMGGTNAVLPRHNKVSSTLSQSLSPGDCY